MKIETHLQVHLKLLTLDYLSTSPMVGKLPLQRIEVEFFLVCEKNNFL